MAGTAAATEIKIGGTGNALGTMQLLGDAYSRKHPDVKVTVLRSLGSSGALLAVPERVIDIGLSSRTLTDEERSKGLVAIEYARTPTVLAVAPKTKVTSLTREQLVDIYTGKLAQWPDGIVIRPILRQPGDDNTRQLKVLSPGIAQALVVAEKRPGLPYAMTDQEAAEKIESVPGAIGVSTLALILSEGRQIRSLPLDGVEPTVKNAASGRYPMVKAFFFITQSTPSPAVQQFISFVRSPAGRDILTQTGHWLP
jgi:phosphate transport system substrate-binding protein